MSSLGKEVATVSLLICLVVGIPALVFSQSTQRGDRQKSTQEKVDNRTEPKESTAETVALGTASVLVSSVQIPVRVATCGATVVVAGLAYVLTAFDREARQAPAEAIKRVCGGSYVTTPQDLRRD